MTFILLLFLLFVSYLVFVHLYPIRSFRASSSTFTPSTLPDIYVYSFQIHLHSQFSYDSLGKPEDIIRTARGENIDYVIVTDHENDNIRHFADNRLIAGIEKKITNEIGEILGDLLIVEDIKVVAHPFKEKYRWKLELPQEYFFELVNLKDALLERKGFLLLLLPYMLFSALLSRKNFFEPLKSIIDIGRFASLYLKMGISNPVVGGLDHHVKVYLREVGVRFLFPDYLHSFRLMRNFLITQRKIKDKKDFIGCLKGGKTLISFSEKPTLYWKEESLIKILPPARCLLIKRTAEGEEFYEGASFGISPERGTNLFLGYTYRLKIKSLYFGLKPLFLFVWNETTEEQEKGVFGTIEVSQSYVTIKL